MERHMTTPNTLSRRTALTGLALVSTAVLPAVARAVSPDVSAAVNRYRVAERELNSACVAHDEAESDAEVIFGRRPCELVTWRSWMVGVGELERVRDQLFAHGGNTLAEHFVGNWELQIDREYRDARKRLAAKIKAGRAWDKETGVAPSAWRQLMADKERRDAIQELSAVAPTSVADALAIQGAIFNNLIALERNHIEDWEAKILLKAHNYIKSQS